MAPRTTKATETETVSALKESTALPISVGNPAAADCSRSINRTWRSSPPPRKSPSMSEFEKPPKGHYFTVRAEPTKPWKDRAFYFLLEIEGRDPYIVAPAIAKLKSGRGRDSARSDCPLCHDGGRGRVVGAQARQAGRQVQPL